MYKKIIFYAALIVVIGCGTLFIGRAMSTGASPVSPKTSILTATRDLPAGTFLEEKDLVWREADETASPSLAEHGIYKGQLKEKDLAGAILRVSLHKGAPLSRYDFIKPGESAFLAAVLRPGSRAATIRIDAATGGSEVIRPGNRVDVVLSGKLESNGSRTLGLPAAKTLLEDVRVIAVGKETEFTPNPGKSGDTQVSSKGPAKRTATLEVSPKEVEILTVAQNLGDLSLSLRSLLDGEEANLAVGSGITSAEELVRMDKTGPSAKSVVVIYGTEQSRVNPQ